MVRSEFVEMEGEAVYSGFLWLFGQGGGLWSRGDVGRERGGGEL